MIPLAILAAGVLVAAAVLFAAHYEHVIRQRHRRQVIVTCKSGTSWRGTLAETDRTMVVLRNTENLVGTDTVNVDGEVLLHRADIEFLQRL